MPPPKSNNGPAGRFDPEGDQRPGQDDRRDAEGDQRRGQDARRDAEGYQRRGQQDQRRMARALAKAVPVPASASVGINRDGTFPPVAKVQCLERSIIEHGWSIDHRRSQQDGSARPQHGVTTDADGRIIAGAHQQLMSFSNISTRSPCIFRIQSPELEAAGSEPDPPLPVHGGDDHRANLPLPVHGGNVGGVGGTSSAASSSGFSPMTSSDEYEQPAEENLDAER